MPLAPSPCRPHTVRTRHARRCGHCHAGHVVFERVRFAYNQSVHPVLHGVSFNVPGKSTAALVGATGSGTLFPTS